MQSHQATHPFFFLHLGCCNSCLCLPNLALDGYSSPHKAVINSLGVPALSPRSPEILTAHSLLKGSDLGVPSVVSWVLASKDSLFGKVAWNRWANNVSGRKHQGQREHRDKTVPASLWVVTKVTRSTQLSSQCLPCIHKAPSSSQAPYKAAVVALTYNPSNQEAEAGGSVVQGHPWLHRVQGQTDSLLLSNYKDLFYGVGEVAQWLISFTRPRFESQHTHSGSKSIITPVPVGLMPSSDLPQYCMHVVHIHTFRQNTNAYKMNWYISDHTKGQIPVLLTNEPSRQDPLESF